MNVEFIEKYKRLSDLKPGECATSKDRERFFVCAYYYCNIKKVNIPVIVDLNYLNDQYTEKRDMSQPIKILDSGDKFICSR